VPLDPKQLPRDVNTLQKIVLDLAEQLDRSLEEQNKYHSLLREFLEAQRNRKSERLSKEQLALFEAAWQARGAEPPEAADEDDDDLDSAAGGAGQEPDARPDKKRGGRQALARHLRRERIVHDLAESEKHCKDCGQHLRLIAEESSERYEYIPASMKVIEDVCLKYACACTVKAARKPPQPIQKSTAGASLLAQVIVAKWADHQPLHRQEKMFARHGVEISRKTMGGWMAQCAHLLDPLYQAMKKELFGSKVIGTDDTSVKVLDRKLSFARIGRIWPYVGDARHPVIVYDYTPTRSRAGPAKFLEGYRGYLQADAYSVYDAFFKGARGMIEVGCWMHARRYVFKALESDEARMGPLLHLIARVYAVEERAKALALSGEQRRALRQRVSARLMGKLHQYLLEMRPEVLPKSPSGAAVRYALNQWEALTRFLEDGDLEIDNGATERANRDIALGRGNWTFFGSDNGGKTAAVLRSFIASCKRCGVEPFAWFRDVLSRTPAHPITRVSELLPHNWKPLPSPAQA
jgi:transposase